MNVCLGSRRREVGHSIFKEPGKPHGTCHRSHSAQAADHPDYLATDYPGNATVLLRPVCAAWPRGTATVGRAYANHRTHADGNLHASQHLHHGAECNTDVNAYLYAYSDSVRVGLLSDALHH